MTTTDQWQNQWPIASGPYNKRIDCTKKNGPVGYHPKLIKSWATNWWDYEHGLTIAAFFDFDHTHGTNPFVTPASRASTNWHQKHPAIWNVASRAARAGIGLSL